MILLLIEDQVLEVPAVNATGTFAAGDKTGTVDFHLLDSKNNPLNTPRQWLPQS